jgi:hypothetical protein
MYLVRTVARSRFLNPPSRSIVGKRYRPCAAIDIEYR